MATQEISSDNGIKNIFIPRSNVSILGTRVPRLAYLRPVAWLELWPSAAHLHQLKLKTLARDQASRGGRRKASSGAASPGRLARRRRDQGRVPREVLVTQAIAGLCSVLVSSLVQRGQAQAWSTEASGKGCLFGATRPRLVERHDGGHCGAQDGVIVRAFGSRRPALVRISVLDVSLQNGQLLAPFLLNIWEEDQGLSLYI